MLSRSIAVSSILSVMLIYFAYHMFAGNRGLIAYFSYKNTISEKERELDAISSEQKMLESKIRMLYRDSIDLDFLDELARNKLGLIAEDEECILNYTPGDLGK